MNSIINANSCRGNLPTSKEDTATEERLILKKKVTDCADCGEIEEGTKVKLLTLIGNGERDKNINLTREIYQLLENAS